MKKAIFLLLFVAPLLYSQTGNGKSFAQLKNEVLQFNYDKDNQAQLNAVTPGKKNPGIAICLSLLLPGMGELYAGSYDSGKYFTIADVLLWGTLIGFDSYGNWEKDNYKSYAQNYGGIDPAGKDDNYYANLGDYLSINDYNTSMNFQREFGSVYNIQKYYWNWTTDARRIEYRDMWRKSEQAYNNIRFVVGALILNRVISIINSVRLVTLYNKNLEQNKQVAVSFSPNYLVNKAVGISLNLSASF